MKIKLAVAAASGFALGFVVCKRFLEQTYIDAANEEVAKMEEALQVKEKLDEVADVLSKEECEVLDEEPSKLSEKWTTEPYTDADRRENTIPESEVAEPVERIAYNKIVSHYDTETQRTEPFVPPQSRMVDETEFFANPHENSLQLTYYAGSDVLMDAATKELVTQETIIKYLGGFHLDANNYTGDAKMLYIRADAVQLDIEVELNMGEPEEG